MSETVFAIAVLFSLASALGVVFARNPVYSAFSLVLCFFGLSGVYILWGATFIGMVQILVYTGAIVVLFVFVVMLLDLVKSVLSPSAGWLMVTVAGGTVWCIALLLLRTLNRSSLTVVGGEAKALQLKNVAMLLFTEYVWPFEVLGVFLLALVVAVHILSRPDEDTDGGKVK